MSDRDELYRTWRSEGSYLNAMLDCGDFYNQWVEIALEYLPIEVFDDHKENLVFVSAAQRDGCRLARQNCENREVVLLSERILPKRGAIEDDPDVRYFIFVVLHEIVHAIKKHKSPKFDSLSDVDNQAQEDEADSLALEWFNRHVEALNNPYMKPVTIDEIEAAQERNQRQMKEQYNGV